MKPSRKVVAAFVAVFVMGAIVGVLNESLFYDMRFPRFLSGTNDPASMTTRINQNLVKKYNLSDDQQKKIAPLTQAMAQRLYQLRRQFGADFIATLDDYHEKVAAEMTPNQRADYAKLNEERRKRAMDMLLPDQAPAPSP
jgi:hypothetical protein